MATNSAPSSDCEAKLNPNDIYGPLLSKTSVHCADSLDWLRKRSLREQCFDLIFLDPPFNQGKEYRHYDDDSDPAQYWAWMAKICELAYNHASDGASIYFMQREKNASETIAAVESAGWTFQNLIVWKKKTSAIPSTCRYSKSYQIIVFASKGRVPRTFNQLRIDPPLLKGYRPRDRGMLLTDLWDDIRELTSGYFAGKEVLRDSRGERIHKQQSPIALLLRIVLVSSLPTDLVFDPFAGTGTSLVVARQLQRESIGIEVDPFNVELIEERLRENYSADLIEKFKPLYQHTEDLDRIWNLTTSTGTGHIG